MDGQEFQTATLKRALLAKLVELGVREVVCAFRGSSDNGDVGEIEFFSDDATMINVGDVHVQWRVQSATYDDVARRWVRSSDVKPTSIESAFSDMAHDVAHASGIDWVNDAGGQGNVTFTIETTAAGELNCRVDLHIEQNVTTTREFNHSVSFDTLTIIEVGG